MSKRRNWILIAFGVVVVIVFIGIGAIIAMTAWVQQNLTVQESTEQSAQGQFETVRARYSARPPLLDFRDGRASYSGGTPPAPPASPAPITNLHVLVWDPDDGRLSSLAIPFWILRLKSGPIEFSTYASGMDDERVNLRPEDIEKYGPGIILDTTSPSGERILLWAE